MKSFSTILLCIFTLTKSYGQRPFIFKSDIGEQSVQVNGKAYLIDSIGVRIKTHYPLLDTLVFLTESANSKQPILCNFKPDSLYFISAACCGSLHLVEASQLINDSLKYWDYETDFDKIQNQLMVKPFISIRTIVKPKDTIYAWHADAACMTECNPITNKPWSLGVPPKCFYWSNITYVQFFKTNPLMPTHQDTDMEEFLGIKNIVELNHIAFILFDEEKFMITYDEKKNAVSINYDNTK